MQPQLARLVALSSVETLEAAYALSLSTAKAAHEAQVVPQSCMWLCDALAAQYACCNTEPNRHTNPDYPGGAPGKLCRTAAFSLHNQCIAWKLESPRLIDAVPCSLGGLLCISHTVRVKSEVLSSSKDHVTATIAWRAFLAVTTGP